jgi:hypothetical protein
VTKISFACGGFVDSLSTLQDYDNFGLSIAPVGDLDGDGVQDIAVAAGSDNYQGIDTGAIRILFLNRDGTVKALHRITDYPKPLPLAENLGDGLAWLGDLDGAGPSIGALVAGAASDDQFLMNGGVVHVLFLNSNLSIHRQQIIPVPGLNAPNEFGTSVASLGDLDGAGGSAHAIAVGAPTDRGNGIDRGAVYVISLSDSGSVLSSRRLSDRTGDGLEGLLHDFDRFGYSVAALGDIDDDPTTVQTLAVGTPRDDAGGNPGADYGAVWLLFLRADGSIARHQKIGRIAGGFTGILAPIDRFGISVSQVGDIDGNGTPDLGVGAVGDDGSGSESGALWLVLLNPDGTVHWQRKIAAGQGGFSCPLHPDDRFGNSVALLPDLDLDGNPELAVGAYQDSDGGPFRGAVYIIFRGRIVTTSDVNIQASSLFFQPPTPNPFRVGSQFGFTLESDQLVRLEIYDVAGRAVRTLLDAPVTAGRHLLRWDGRTATGARASAGVYYLRLRTPRQAESIRLTLVQ